MASFEFLSPEPILDEVVEGLEESCSSNTEKTVLGAVAESLYVE